VGKLHLLDRVDGGLVEPVAGGVVTATDVTSPSASMSMVERDVAGQPGGQRLGGVYGIDALANRGRLGHLGRPGGLGWFRGGRQRLVQLPGRQRRVG
jgi:hypothetical protein